MGGPVNLPIVADASLVSHSVVRGLGERVVVDRRLGGRPQDGRDRRHHRAPRLVSRTGVLTFVRVCPACGGEHSAPFTLDMIDLWPQLASCASSFHRVPAPSPIVRDKVVWWSLLFLWLLNLGDLLMTRAALDAGARETNVLMGWLLSLGFVPAAVFKMGIVTLGILILWRYRRYPVALTGSVALAGVYALVVVYQLSLSVAH